jgi:hypothetical protein
VCGYNGVIAAKVRRVTGEGMCCWGRQCCGGASQILMDGKECLKRAVERER